MESSATTSTATDPKSWVKDLLNWKAQLKLADVATQVAQGQRRATLVNRLVEHTQNRTFGIKGVSKVPDPDDIRVGSPETVTNNHAAPSSLVPLLAAAAMAAGIGVPLTVAAMNLPSIIAAMNPPKPSTTVIQPTTPGDGNTKHRLRLGKPTE